MLEVISLLSNILTNPSSPMKELLCEIPFIISNHPDLKYIAEQFEIPFFHFPLVADSGDKSKAKAEQEALIEAAIAKYEVDTLVMARYMQVLSDDFCDKHASHPPLEGGRRHIWPRLILQRHRTMMSSVPCCQNWTSGRHTKRQWTSFSCKLEALVAASFW